MRSSSNIKLTKLKLACNNIGDRDMKVFAKAIKANKTITELDLSGVRIGLNNILSFASMIRKNTKIEVLTLNYFSDFVKTKTSGSFI